MYFANSPKPPRTTPPEVSQGSIFNSSKTIEKTPGNGNASNTAPKMFSIGETQTNTPRAKSEKPVRRIYRHPISTCQSVLGSSPVTPKTQTASPGFIFNVTSPPLTTLFSDPKSTPCSAPIGPPKPPSSELGLLQLQCRAATRGSIKDGNTPASPGTLPGQDGSTLPATFIANGPNKLNVPASFTAVTGVTPPKLFPSSPSSTSTGSTPGNAGVLDLATCEAILSSKNSSPFPRLIPAIPASSTCTGPTSGIPASSTSTSFTGFTFTTTPESTGQIFGTPASLVFSVRPSASLTTSSNESSLFDATTSTGTGFQFGRAPFMLTGAFPLMNTTAPTNFATVTGTSGSQASLGTVTTVTNSSSGDNYNNVRISCSENNSDDDRNKMKKNPQAQKFTTTFESFFPLVDNDYWIRARREPQFHENISLSMYRYYMAQHLYARLVQIRAAKGVATTDEQKFANHVQSVAPSISNGIFTYLITIGDIQIPDNVTSSPHFFEYSLLTWPNKKGHFGELNHENHWMYMSFPAPAIVTQAIEEDLDMDDMNPQSIWDLKNNLKPSYSYALSATPNANLLGWKPATILTISQRQKLQLCGIFQDSFNVINSQFQFNPKIMSIIHDYLQESPRAICNVEKYYEKRSKNFGGIEQLAWLERDDEGEDVPFSKTFASVERNVQGTLHPAQGESESASKLALIMGFRIDKSKGGNDWVVYDQGNYGNLPRGWIETRNKVFEFGDIGGVQGGREIPGSWRRDAMRHEFLEKCYLGMYHHE